MLKYIGIWTESVNENELDKCFARHTDVQSKSQLDMNASEWHIADGEGGSHQVMSAPRYL